LQFLHAYLLIFTESYCICKCILYKMMLTLHGKVYAQHQVWWANLVSFCCGSRRHKS